MAVIVDFDIWSLFAKLGASTAGTFSVAQPVRQAQREGDERRAVGHSLEGHERVPRRWRKPVPRAREVEAEASDSRSTGD